MTTITNTSPSTAPATPASSTPRERLLREIAVEREQHDWTQNAGEDWQQSAPDWCFAIGQRAEDTTWAYFNPPTGTAPDVRAMRHALVEIAALTLAAIEWLDQQPLTPEAPK